MKKAVVIIGPTAVGKTSLAVKLAQKFNGALISADSVQVFKSLDIISGKDKKELENVEYYMIDTVNPNESFSVSQFEKKASNVLNSVTKIPIIVGGTGLYVKAIIDGVATGDVRPNYKLRAKLETLNLKELQEKLKDMDKNVWGEMNDSDSKNKRRLIRKIEILMNGKWQMANGRKQDIEFLQIGLEMPREMLKEKIDERVEERLKMGALKEAERLFENYVNLTQQVKDANGYKQLFEYLKGEINLNDAIEKWKLSEYKHAKNQMTWFKKDTRIEWFDAQDENLLKSVEKKVDSFLASIT